MLGYLPDPEKPGDYDAAEVLGAITVPPAASCRHLVWDILNQGSLNSCVANAGFQAIRASHKRQGTNFPRLGSRLFGWYLSRATHGAQLFNEGTYLRSFFEVLNKVGFCTEDTYPYDFSRLDKMPSTAAFREAFDQKSPTVYRRIFSTGWRRVDDVKRAIASGYLVCFGTNVSTAFVDDPGTAPLPPPIKQRIAGGHAMCLGAYNGDDFSVVNSWGPRWGAGGWCTFSADYVAWEHTRDLWIVEHAPRYSDEPR